MWRWIEKLREDERIDTRLSAELRRPLSAFNVHSKELPQFRFVDLYRAAEHYCQPHGVTATIESDHRIEPLSGILHAKPSRWIPRRMGRAERIAWPVGVDQEMFLPVDI